MMNTTIQNARALENTSGLLWLSKQNVRFVGLLMNIYMYINIYQININTVMWTLHKNCYSRKWRSVWRINTLYILVLLSLYFVFHYIPEGLNNRRNSHKLYELHPSCWCCGFVNWFLTMDWVKCVTLFKRQDLAINEELSQSLIRRCVFHICREVQGRDSTYQNRWNRYPYYNWYGDHNWISCLDFISMFTSENVTRSCI